MIKLHSIWEHCPLGAPSFHIQAAPARVCERRSGRRGGMYYGWLAGNGPRREEARTESVRRPAAGQYYKTQLKTLGRLK